MKSYLINLDRSPSRLVEAGAQLSAAGIDYVRVPATDGQTLTLDVISKECSRFGFLLANARRIKVNELGCAMSHRECWRRLLASAEDRAAVFEDDVQIDGVRYAIAMKLIEKEDDGHPAVWLLNHRNKVVDPGVATSVQLLGTVDEIHTCWGAEGYVLNRAAAEILVRLQTPVVHVADDWSVYARRGIDVRIVFPTVCGLRNVVSDIARNMEGRAGWGWYLAFGRFKYWIAFHLDNLCYRLRRINPFHAERGGK